MGLHVDATGNTLTYQIIGAAMRVHNQLGYGHKEKVYERALAAELAAQGIEVRQQHQVEVHHEGALVGLFRFDLFVEGVVLVEVKALGHQLTDDELAQVINYLTASKALVGLLFNFGRRRLEYRRVFPSPDAGAQPGRTGRDSVIRPKR